MTLSSPDVSETVKEFFERSDLYLTGNLNIQLRAEIVSQFLQNRDFKNVLDIACGSAEISIPYVNENNRLTLIDIAENMLDVAAKNVPETLTDRVEYRCGDFRKLDFGDQQFDLIISTGLLAHIPDPFEALVRMAELLSPGGVLVLQNLNSSHPYSQFIHFYRYRVGARCLLNFREQRIHVG